MRTRNFLMVLVAMVVVVGCSSTPKAIPPTRAIPPTSSGPDYSQQLDQMTRVIEALTTKVEALTAKVTQVEQANTALGQRVGQVETGVQAQLQRLEQGLQALTRSAQPNTATGQLQPNNSPPSVARAVQATPIPVSRAVFEAPSKYFAYVGERPHDLWGYARLLEINNNSNAYVSVRIDNREVLFIIRRGGILNPAGEILLPPHQKAWCLLDRLGLFEAVAEGFEESHPGSTSSVPLGQTRIPFELTEDLEQGILIRNFN